MEKKIFKKNKNIVRSELNEQCMGYLDNWLLGKDLQGLNFVELIDIIYHFGYGTKLAFVSVHDEELVYVAPCNEYRTDRLIIEKIVDLYTIETMQLLVANGVNFNNISFRDAISYASSNGQLDVLKYIHKHGANMNNIDAMLHAATNGHLEVVKYLHKNGTDIMNNFNSPLLCAVKFGHLDIVKYLCKNGASVVVYNNEPICSAAANGFLDMVKYLHKHGADIFANNNQVIYIAVANGRLDVVKYLCENGVNPEEGYYNVVLLAASRGQLDILKYFYENGANTMIFANCKELPQNTAEYLIEHGIKVKNVRVKNT